MQQLLDSAWEMVLNNYLEVIAAIIILVIGRMVAGWARKLTRKSLERGDVDATLVPFVAKLVYYLVLAVVVIAALNRLGVATTSVVAIFGAAGLAVGLALQGTLGNFASGVMLLVFRPFDVGDYVDAGGTAGTVMEIGIFATTLKSPDNIKITVPNSQVYGATISNYNGYDSRRVDMVMGISYDDNIQTAMDTIHRIVTADERVLADPAPQIARPTTGPFASISTASSRKASRRRAARFPTRSGMFICIRSRSDHESLQILAGALAGSGVILATDAS
jgi:small conductance mechanosensitive channel